MSFFWKVIREIKQKKPSFPLFFLKKFCLEEICRKSILCSYSTYNAISLIKHRILPHFTHTIYSPFPLPTVLSSFLMLLPISSLSANDVNSSSFWWFWYELWLDVIAPFCFPVCGMDPNVAPWSTWRQYVEEDRQGSWVYKICSVKDSPAVLENGIWEHSWCKNRAPCM